MQWVSMPFQYEIQMWIHAAVTLNGIQTSYYFELHPPTFQEWIIEGPRLYHFNRKVLL